MLVLQHVLVLLSQTVSITIFLVLPLNAILASQSTLSPLPEPHVPLSPLTAIAESLTVLVLAQVAGILIIGTQHHAS